MANYLKIFDTVEFKPIEISDVSKIDDNFNATTNANAPLIVKIAATHSGLITRNNGFYLPDRMRKGAASFTAHYGKPIQVHHDENKDPIGRVLKAEYVDISSSVKDAFLQKIINSSRGQYTDKFIKDFFTGNVPYISSVNFIVDSLNSKDSILDDPDYKGLGYIQLTASIADPEAKLKVLDGRYLTGSVGVTTNHAVCSVCKQDWTGSDGRCEHKPGKMYDGAKAFIITGDLTYDEYSFVNTPADRHSGVIEVNVNGITDSVAMDNSVGRSIMVNLFTDSIDIAKSTGTINNISQEAPMQNKLTELLSSLKPKFELVDETEFEAIVKSLGEINPESLEDIDFLNGIEVKLDRASIDKVFAMETDKKLDGLKKVRPFMEETGLANLVTQTFADANLFYDAINALEWEDYSEAEDDAITAYLAEHAEDGKLSGAARKRLPSSSFCGPNKSFPVPDKAHVTAARRLIGRAKVSSSTKARILACVSRKAAAMGKDAAIQEQKVMPTEIVDNKELETVKAQLADALKQIETLNTEKVATQVIVDGLTKEKADFDKVLDATRAELNITREDLIQMTDRIVTVEEESLKLLVDKVITFRMLSGEVIEDAVKISNELLATEFNAIKEQLIQVESKVDMKKITDSINSGLARKPTGSVTDPTGNLLVQDKVKYTKEKVSAVAEEYRRIQLGGNSIYGRGTDAAERYRKDMQFQGHIPTG